MKDALLIVAALLIGSGLGLLFSDYVLSPAYEVAGLPLLIQPLLIPLTWFLQLLVKSGHKHWAVALCVSFASAISAAPLRVAATVLMLKLSSSETFPSPFLASLTTPHSLLEASALSLLAVSFTLMMGQLLLASSFSRLLSPLWLGIESLPTPFEAPAEVDLRSLLFVAPVGILLALFDAESGKLMGKAVFPYPLGFALLYLTALPAATALTFALHMLLLAFSSSFIGGGLTLSLGLGVQLGIVTSTVVAAFLAYAWGGAAMYLKRAASIMAGMLGVLLLLLSYVIVAQAYAAYLLAGSALLLLIVTLIAARLEGGTFSIFYPTTPVIPSLFQYSWISTVRLLASLIGDDLKYFSMYLANPYLMFMVATMSVWECKFSENISSVAVLPLAVGIPLLLVLLRAFTAAEDYSLIARSPVLRLPEVNPLDRLDPLTIFLSATLTAVAVIAVYYGLPVESNWRRVQLFLDPNGLFFTYSTAPMLVQSGFRSDVVGIFLLAFAFFTSLRLILLESRALRSIRRYAYGGVLTYGLAFLVLVIYQVLRLSAEL